MFKRVIYFKPLTLQEEILLGNARDIKAFHKSLGLPTNSIIFIFKKHFVFYI